MPSYVNNMKTIRLDANASNTLCINASEWERHRANYANMNVCDSLSAYICTFICARLIYIFLFLLPILLLFRCTLHHVQWKPRDVHTFSSLSLCLSFWYLYLVFIFGMYVGYVSVCIVRLGLKTSVMHMDRFNLFIHC